MGMCVCNGATLQCSFGAAPSTMVVLPTNKVLTCNQPAATIMDNKPTVNIMPFGMCNSPNNPQVAAANSPQPCMPVISMPQWGPGAPTVLIGNTAALNDSSQIQCNWSGLIQITAPGQFKTQVP